MCYQLSSRKMDTQSVINLTVVGQLSWQCLRARALDCWFITGDRQGLSTARYSREGQLPTADTCSSTCSRRILVGKWKMSVIILQPVTQLTLTWQLLVLIPVSASSVLNPLPRPCERHCSIYTGSLTTVSSSFVCVQERRLHGPTFIIWYYLFLSTSPLKMTACPLYFKCGKDHRFTACPATTVVHLTILL